ncbi:MAG: hypothetical protein IJX13_06835 [Clostridia bacterium]|nr:hypothetical protein [Clostridia bacterium]
MKKLTLYLLLLSMLLSLVACGGGGGATETTTDTESTTLPHDYKPTPDTAWLSYHAYYAHVEHAFNHTGEIVDGKNFLLPNGLYYRDMQFEDENLPEKTFVYYGSTLSLSYDRSYLYEDGTGKRIYRCKNGDKSDYAEFDVETGALKHLRLYNASSEAKEETASLSQEKCKDIAFTYLEDYAEACRENMERVIYLQLYSLFEQGSFSRQVNEKDRLYYWFHYARTVQGFATEDDFYIVVDAATGKVVQFRAGTDIGHVENFAGTINFELAHQAVREMMEAYDQQNALLNHSHEMNEEPVLILRRPGVYMLQYTIPTHWESRDGDSVFEYNVLIWVPVAVDVTRY